MYNFRKKLISLSDSKIEWKILIIYFAITTIYLFIIFVPFLFGEQFSFGLNRPPAMKLLYYALGPIVQSLLLVLVGSWCAIKFLAIPKNTISIFKLINLFFFAKMVGWLSTMPFVLLGGLTFIPVTTGLITHVSHPTISSFLSTLNFNIINPLYPWVASLVYGVLLVGGIILSIQDKK